MSKMLLAFGLLLVATLTITGTACKTADGREARSDAQKFIDDYTEKYLKLYYDMSRAEWRSNTHIVEGDESNAKKTRAANEAYAAFTGSSKNIEKVKALLAKAEALTPLEKRQLDKILYTAAGNPEPAAAIIKEQIALSTKLVEQLYGFAFKIDGKEVTPNEINKILREETDVTKRQKAWEAAKEVGKGLRPGMVHLRELRNKAVAPLNYSDFFTYQVSDYGMTTAEMMQLADQMLADLKPLYRELHTYYRYELAKKYKQPVPEYLPAHWLPNQWGQTWGDLVAVEGLDLNAPLKEKSPEWLVQQAERFYVSLGFSRLPDSFWKNSSLYPVGKDAGYKKNTHASAWHMDLQNDVRSLMSVENNDDWYMTTHHELGHIYYYMSYTNPQVPPLLREGANRAYHEAVGTMMGMAAMQPAFVQGLGLAKADVKLDKIKLQLKEALDFVVFTPWSAGVMTHFEHDIYSNNLPENQWNKRWWELVKQYQGIVPPTARGEEYCDPTTKTHIIDDAGQYYDYAIANLILMQLHQHIATKILHQDPHNTNYYGSKEVGEFLKGILTPGASIDWRAVLKEKTGSDLSAKPMLEYFDPLYKWLKEQNRGRKYSI